MKSNKVVGALAASGFFFRSFDDRMTYCINVYVYIVGCMAEWFGSSIQDHNGRPTWSIPSHRCSRTASDLRKEGLPNMPSRATETSKEIVSWHVK